MSPPEIGDQSKKNDLSVVGIEKDPFDGEWEDEPFEPTFADIGYFEQDDDDEFGPDFGGVMRISESYYDQFWTYFNRFVRYWPRKSFNVKYAYEKGFIEKKKKRTGQVLPLFEKLAIEMTERHLCASNWSERKGESFPDDPIWLALHMPKLTTVDLIDVDAKQYRVGYYREHGDRKARLLPVMNIPLEHFKMLKRIYDHFPERIWCISSETLGIHAWKKHKYLQPTAVLHQINKTILANIGLAAIESHPMPGRCLRRPFGDGYRTIKPTGTIEDWVRQVEYFESDDRTPSFNRICVELVGAMYRQWQAWRRFGDDYSRIDARSRVEKQLPELGRIADWLKAGCPLETAVTISVQPPINSTLSLCQEVLTDAVREVPETEASPIQRICREILLVSFGEKTDEDISPIVEKVSSEINGINVASTFNNEPRPKSSNQNQDLVPLRGGNWAKELLRLARNGLQQDDSVAMVVYEMAKWLWWIELYSLPKTKRLNEITKLLSAYVLAKHNNCVSRLLNGQQDDVLAHVARCVKQASEIKLPSSIEGFSQTRKKWNNGGYAHPVRLVPALTQQEDVSLSSSCQFTIMCIKFDEQLPESVQAKIKSSAGRNKVMPFSTRLINLLYSKQGKAFVGRKTLTALLGYENPNQIAKYTAILERTGIISIGNSYKVGRNGKEYRLSQDTIKIIESVKANPDA